MDFSILNQVPISHNGTAKQALKNAIELAVVAEETGYARYFVAEHHNTNNLVSTAPEIVVAHLLAKTEKINIGTGGIMLQHYNPFKVVEQFHLLNQLAPNRVDLGVGKAPGGLPLSTEILQYELEKGKQNFDEKFKLLNQFNRGDFDSSHKWSNIKTTQKEDNWNPPNVYLLGGSEHTASFAASEKVNFIFAHFINANQENLDQALKIYKNQYPDGKIIVAIATVIIDNDADERFVKDSMKNYRIHLHNGKSLNLGSLEQVEEFKAQTHDSFEVEEVETEIIKGSTYEVNEQIEELNHLGLIDEVMLHIPVNDHKLRKQTILHLSPKNQLNIKEKEEII